LDVCTTTHVNILKVSDETTTVVILELA